MDIVNPLAGNVAESASVVQRQQSAGKAQQVRREQALRKDVAAPGDRFDRQVESCEALNPIHDDRNDGHRGNARRDPEPSQAEGEEPPHVDVRA